uniref:Tudor domain-containing protein n=1 Tax=Calidris pygmaea TaxID=425635 RepID=A0A8C3JBJ9_9CHAR
CSGGRGVPSAALTGGSPLLSPSSQPRFQLPGRRAPGGLRLGHGEPPPLLGPDRRAPQPAAGQADGRDGPVLPGQRPRGETPRGAVFPPTRRSPEPPRGCHPPCVSPPPQAELPTVQAGDIVAAPYANDSEWYRARVLGRLENGNFDLYYVDFGDNGEAPREALRALRSDFLSLPFQAIECSLAGIVPVGEKEGGVPRAGGPGFSPSEVVSSNLGGGVSAPRGRARLGRGSAGRLRPTHPLRPVETAAGKNLQLRPVRALPPAQHPALRRPPGRGEPRTPSEPPSSLPIAPTAL